VVWKKPAAAVGQLPHISRAARFYLTPNNSFLFFLFVAIIDTKLIKLAEKCALAVTNVFAHALQKDRESQNQREDTKLDIAVCLSYLRRLLQIDFAPSSQPGEMALAMKVHYRLVYHFRVSTLMIHYWGRNSIDSR
jgi:hypothetical protein